VFPPETKKTARKGGDVVVFTTVRFPTPELPGSGSKGRGKPLSVETPLAVIHGYSLKEREVKLVDSLMLVNGIFIRLLWFW
jgi:hypothetical protein